MSDKLRSSALQETLERIAQRNPDSCAGKGIPPGHFVPLVHYHSRSVAHELVECLRANEISVRVKPSRMSYSIHVAFEDRQRAYEIVEEFKLTHSDIKKRAFSRDFDLVFLVIFATLVIASATMVVGFRWVACAILVSGISISVIVERLHRGYRYFEGFRFTILELAMLTIIVAINVLLWKTVL